ncbi:MAG: ATP-NAD kinase family protein [Methanoregula sp.]|nr:MAG: ATP-NAD kinase family protein [Methanoregula sp.]
MHTIGFLINPYAGMGGAVGLKGTDGLVYEATIRGAVPHAQKRAEEALRALKCVNLRFFTCSGNMGEAAMQKAKITHFSVEYCSPEKTTAEDTKNACRKFLNSGVEMIVFCGGDGTARDVFDVVGTQVPMLGIPAGVKMYSGVFAVSPQAAAELLEQTGTTPLRDGEVVDVDEGAYRGGALRTTLYGYAKTPYILEKVAGTKQVFEQPDEERAKAEIAQFISEVVDGTPDKLTILGPGTTTKMIADVLGVNKTLLGFDAIRGRMLVAADLSENGILALLSSEREARLIISIIGAQGFVLGRGTQQVSPAVIRIIGINNIIVVATPYKLSRTPVLYVDTGDSSLDAAFGDHMQVISGYRIAQRKRIYQPMAE